MNISMDFDSKKLQRGFVNIEKANQIAVQGTLNTQAALTRRNAIGNLESNFINRNTFTKRQIQFQKTEIKAISQMEARTGATERAGYMELQETGGDNKPKKGANLAIPTNRARNNSKSSLVRRAVYQRAIKKKKVKGRFQKQGTRKSRMVAMAYVAERENKLLKINSGIYSVSTFKKTKTTINYKRSMIYNTKESSVNILSNPWLEPATKKPIQDGQAIYNSQINKLLKKDVI